MPQSVLEDELEGIQWHIKVLQERIKNGKGKHVKFCKDLRFAVIQYSFLDGSKSRNLIRHKVTILKARGKKVIDILNSQQNEYVVEEETIKSGKFPWQLLQKNGEVQNILKKCMLLYIFLRLQPHFINGINW